MILPLEFNFAQIVENGLMALPNDFRWWIDQGASVYVDSFPCKYVVCNFQSGFQSRPQRCKILNFGAADC